MKLILSILALVFYILFLIVFFQLGTSKMKTYLGPSWVIFIFFMSYFYLLYIIQLYILQIYFFISWNIFIFKIFQEELYIYIKYKNYILYSIYFSRYFKKFSRYISKYKDILGNMFTCDLCNKSFIFKSKLTEHKNRKYPCNKSKESTKCDLCCIEFPCLSKLEKHKQSKKHIFIENQYINDNRINITIENINNINQNELKLQEEIELLDIERLLIYEDEIHTFIKDFKQYPDEIYGDSQYIIYIFKFFIKIFAKLNFNLAYSENHNCMIFSFNKSDSKFIEYQLLEINNTQFNYEKKCIDYKLFIEQFLNLMNRVNNKFKNDTLDYVYRYVIRYKQMVFTSENAKIHIENELLTQYTKFEESKNIEKSEEERFRIALLTSRANAFKGIINRIK